MALIDSPLGKFLGVTKKADALSKIASTSFAHLSKQVLVEILKNKSISEMEISTMITSGSTWMTPQTIVLAESMRVLQYASGTDLYSIDQFPRLPQQELTPINLTMPFHKWGIDIAGPFPVAAGGLKFLIVAIDYFTKWIEAKAVATITGNQVKRFVWDNIVCRFGLPGEIVSDNGKQ
ncbi:reverse transcriptase domain-containing protein [Tanacetum coccineum]